MFALSNEFATNQLALFIDSVTVLNSQQRESHPVTPNPFGQTIPGKR